MANAFLKRLQMFFDVGLDRQRIDIAQIAVHEDVAEAGDFAPGYAGTCSFLVLRQLWVASESVCRFRNAAS
jgi:hypothetical protein